VTEDARKKLVAKLATAKRFDTNYPVGSRGWFVDRLARVFDAQGMSDADIETHVTDVLTKARALVKTKRAFKIGLPFGKAVATINLGRYVEILYGAIAWHPDFIDPVNSDLLDFIARRRMRSVARMQWWVNPNHKGYFRYFYTCPADETWRVNVDAQTYWQSPSSGDYPITLKRPGGVTPDLKTAVSKIWIAKSKPCDGNLLDCATTASTVMMDSLFEAKDRGTLLAKVDSKNPTNLAINHVNSGPDDFFVTDTSAEGLFTKENRLVGDLEVGDHAYIFNHPLYKVFKPTGSWSGEHSLVFNAGDRSIKQKGILFGGHGKIGTVYDFYDAFLRELQTDLHRAYRIGAIFLAWMDSGKTLFPGKVTTTSETVEVDGTPNVPYELSVFTVSYAYNNYMKPATKKGLAKNSETGFVIAYFSSLHRFYISRKKTKAGAIADGIVTTSALLQQDTTVIESDFDPVNWKVVYFDNSTNDKKRYALYQKVKTKLTFKPLTIEELFESPFYKEDPKKEEIATTTPRVDLSAAYKTFLSTNGGI
jgi:hypothetical protein